MSEEYPFWHAGSAYRITLSHGPDGCSLGLDRDATARLCPKLETLMTQEVTITASADWPALIVYPKGLWDDFAPKLWGLPAMNRAAREIQRKMLGMAMSFDRSEPLRISEDQRGHADLGREVVVIVFDTGWAEIWGCECYEATASKAAG
ncbi:MAG: hypothetical protein KBT82_04310 [Marinobacter sp.]|uniref:hypothetical protein n=1 Tax=Marinobacter sp. TaxID=50741 RepID=UPI001B611DA6|nr:hypothetical protein [Marinobacter sp.]MBQ0747675.1 hypothetical protein [Marinobacter sp.]MBQ0813394.1 hypothetical protein [Marinobacter sp.]